MARQRVSRLSLVSALTLSTALQLSSVPLAMAQTPQQTDGSTGTTQQKTRTPPPPTNPVADAVRDRDRDALRAMQKRGPLPSYVDGTDVSSMRESRVDTDPLPLFGYNVFEPARLAIRARRAALASLAGQPMLPPDQYDENGRRKRPSRAPLTRDELDAVASLTNAQKLALFQKQRDNTLTDADRKKYRALFLPQEGAPPVYQRDPVLDLSPEEKLSLLERQRDGRLTTEDRRKYASLFQARPDRKPKEPSSVELLTTQEKLDLLERQRDGTLTDEEKTKYRDFLLPDVTDRGTPAGSGGDNRGAQGGRQDAGTAPMPPVGSRDPRDPGYVRPQPGDTDYPRRGDMDTATPLGAGARQDTGDLDNTGDATAADRYGPGYTGIYPGGTRYGTYGASRYPRDERYDNYSARMVLQPNDDTQPADAYTRVADPWTLMYTNAAASAPASYQISGGDRIVLRYWSPTMQTREETLRVDPRGYINVPSVGPVNVAGQTAAGAEGVLAARLRGYYRNVQTSVELQQLRTMPVTLSGEAYQGGTYQAPSVASAIDLLIAAGGPTEDGSMRRIEVRRRGALVGTVDLYRLLITGDRSSDIPLQPGDVIYIPGHEARVSLRGEVRHPAIYELIPGETMQDALRYAGGIKPAGVSQRVQVTTVQPGKERVIRDVDATAAAGQRVPVYDGDSIEVLSVRTTIANKVTIEGAVDQPSEYALRDGMTVRDLVMLARGPLPDAYPQVAHLYRVNPDNTTTMLPVDLEKALAGDPKANIKLDRWDRLKVFSRQDFVALGRRQVTVMGAVKREGIYAYSDNMHVRDLLLEAGGTLPEAYTDEAYVMHTHADGTYAYDYVNLAAALRGDAKQNVTLQEKDTLFIFRNEQARFTPEHRVDIQGEVLVQGEYPRGEGMRLSEALKVAGGLTPRAGDKIQVAHARTAQGDPPLVATYATGTGAVTPDPELKDGDVITVQGRGDYRDKPYVVRVEGAVNSPGPVVLDGPRMRLSEVIKMAGGLRPEAFPRGADFHRNPDLLASDIQKQNAVVIARVNDILNQAEYKRDLALSDIERIKALGKAVSSNTPVAIPGIGAITPDTGATAGAVQTGANALFQHDLVSLPRQLTLQDLQPAGNVAVDLPSALQHPDGEEDILMMDGDTIHVPETPTTVQVIGAVMKSTAVQYRREANLRDYVNSAGGYAPDAASEDRILVVHMGGGLAPAKKVKAIEPGDVILVPPKVVAERLSNRSGDIDSVFKGLTGTALIVLVAKKLFGL